MLVLFLGKEFSAKNMLMEVRSLKRPLEISSQITGFINKTLSNGTSNPQLLNHVSSYEASSNDDHIEMQAVYDARAKVSFLAFS